ncbi:polysaccharide deacetylase family protein [Leptospira kirschneri]|uniref:polysaccharide deacetylase family protein n=1 Tax=Leptospira kirschneri TaxID=29507 RepID=UPI00046C6F64|nr:polysaccharide deacetylase family protein [Leptospira kirschneri]KPZ76611.1 polysaccharide deacetylase [Leptospira kirschneri serovar Mozdok]OOV50229.1 polysaccharide deacetylase [Leptospira kirschneri serovar Grippotyphosa]UZW37686.1 polysaccharide deacetylase family protein [Leptospira kirschneri]WBF95995.1 polysaccharide deacetylase family protein [Leptospira kirschneri]WHP01392.1 polysaccharide deacetylase family protein [Leptospira kirschneri]
MKFLFNKIFKNQNFWIGILLFSLNVCGSSSQESQTTTPKQKTNQNGIPVLIYHEIVIHSAKEPGETVITLEKFEEQMKYLFSQGYNPITMKDLLLYIEQGKVLPDKSIVLNFDDGWKNVLNAVPVLNRYSFPASFWIIAGPKGIGNGEYLEWSDIQELAKNPRFEIGSHTYSHPWNPKDNLVTWVDNRVPGKSEKDALFELKESKKILESKLGISIDYLAWPCGWYNDKLIQLAQQSGYKLILTTEDGANLPGENPFKIKRVFIDGKCGLTSFIEQLKNPRSIVCQKSQKPTRGNSPYSY